MEARRNEVFKQIYASDTPVKSTEIAAELGVSERTVRNDINELNSNINETGYQIVRIKNEGYKIQVVHQANFYKYFMSKKNRKKQSNIPTDELIIFFLIWRNHFVSIDVIAETIYVSRSKVINIIEKAKVKTKEFSLTICSKVGKGIKLEGNEKNKRRFLRYFSNEYYGEQLITTFKSDACHTKVEFGQIVQMVEEIAEKHNFLFTGENIELIAFHILIMLSRLENSENLSIPYIYLERHDQQFCSELFATIETIFQLVLPADERNYLASIIVVRKIMRKDSTYLQKKETQELVEKFVRVIYEKYSYDFSTFLVPSSDFFLHMQGILYRQKRQLNLYNPLKNKIKREYAFAYEMVLVASKNLLTINDDELAYLALYVGGALEQEKEVHGTTRKITCLLVCGSGKSTAHMLGIVIGKYVDNALIERCISKKEYDELKYIAQDIVITSITIKQKNCPIIYLNSIPSRAELIGLKSDISYFLMQKQAVVLQLFSEKQFKFYEHYAGTKEKLLLERVEQLQKNDFITETDSFCASLFEREYLGSTALGGGIAIPHPLELNAKKSCVDVVVFKKPIEWGINEQISVMFLLAISKKDYVHFFNIYDYFLEIVYTKGVKKLSGVQDFSAFLNFSKQILANIKSKGGI